MNPAPARSLLEKYRSVFRAVTLAVVPEAERMSPTEWERAEAIVADALAPRPRALLRQLSLLMRAIDLAALVRGGRRLHALSPARRERVLRSFEKSPVLLLRRGFWGLRTLVLMGYYARAEAGQEIGYRADARGWEARSP